MEDKPEARLARMRSHAQAQPRISSPSNTVAKLHPYQVALSRPSLSRYRSGSLKSASEGTAGTAPAVTGEPAVGCIGNHAPQKQLHSAEGNRGKLRVEGRHSIRPQTDSQLRANRPLDSPISPRITRDQLATVLEKAVRACAAEKSPPGASPTFKGPRRFLRSQGASLDESQTWPRESTVAQGSAGCNQSNEQQVLEVRNARTTGNSAAASRAAETTGKGGRGESTNDPATLQTRLQSAHQYQRQSSGVHQDWKGNAPGLEGRTSSPRPWMQQRPSSTSLNDSEESVDTSLDSNRHVLRIGKTVSPCSASQRQSRKGQLVGEGRSQVLTVHGTDVNSTVHSACLSRKPRTSESRGIGRLAVYANGNDAGAVQAAKHAMHRPSSQASSQCAVPRYGVSNLAGRAGDTRAAPCMPVTGVKGSDFRARETCSPDQSKMAPLQFNSQGVAVVADIPNSRPEVQLDIQEAPPDADPVVHGLSLLEYMDLIASEDTAENSHDRKEERAPWMSQLLRSDTVPNASPDDLNTSEAESGATNHLYAWTSTGLEVSATNRMACAGARVRPDPSNGQCIPSSQGGLDAPLRSESSASRRSDALLCQPLANRFSNLPDVELRPGTAACHAFAGKANHSTDDHRSSRFSYHDPALSITHVSLADMAPNLFTAKDHGASSSTPRHQQNSAQGFPATENNAPQHATGNWANIGSESAKPPQHGEPSEDEGDSVDAGDQVGTCTDVKQRPGVRLVQSARPMSPNEPVDEMVWTKQALKRPPSRQKPPPEALHLFSERGPVWKSHGGARRPQTAIGLSHRCRVPPGQSLPAVIPLTATARPVSRHRPPPESLNCFTDVTQRMYA